MYRQLLLAAVVFLVAMCGSVAAQEDFVTTRFERRVVDLEDVEGWLAWIGVETPIELSGQVAVEGSIGVPRGAFLSPRQYRVEARLASERLVMEGIELHDVRADLLYQDGVARLRELSFVVPHGDAPPGQVAGSALLPLSPAGDLTANLQVTQLPLERLLAQFPGLEDFAAGRMSGAVRGQVNPARLGDITAWRLAGNVTLAGAEIQDFPPLNAAAEFQAADGVLTVTQLQGTMRTARLAGSGRFSLSAPYGFTADVQVNDDQLAWLGDLPEAYRPPFPVEGAAQMTGQVQGQLTPLQWRIDGGAAAQQLDFGETELATLAGEFTARGPVVVGELDRPANPLAATRPWEVGSLFRLGDLRVAGLLVNAAQARLTVDETQVRASELTATLYNGAVRGTSRFPLTKMGDALLNLRLEGVDLGRLLADVNLLDFPVRGQAYGAVNLAIPVDDPDDVVRWRGAGQLTLSDVTAFGWIAAVGRADFQLEQGDLILSDFAADQGPMQLRLAGRVGLQNPYAYAVRGEAARLNLFDLNSLPENLRPPARLEGLANVAIEGTGQLAPFSFLGRGGVAVVALRVGNFGAESVSIEFSADEQQWRIADLAANLYGGAIRGATEIPKAEAGEMHLALRLLGLDLGRLLGDLDVLEFPVSVEAEGVVDLTVPRDDPNAMARWSGAGRLALSDVAAFQWTAGAAQAVFQLDRGLLMLSEGTVWQADSQVRLAGSVALQAPHAYALWVDGSQFDLARLNALPQNARPPVALDGVASLQVEGHGQLQPFTFVGRGVGSAAALRVREVLAESVHFAFDVSQQQIEVVRFDATLYGGQANGEGVWPRTDATAARAELHWRGVDIGRLLDDAIQLPVRLQGLSNGDVALSAPPGVASDFRQWHVQADVAAHEILINDVLAGEFKAHAVRQEDLLTYRLDAAILQGQVQAEGRLPLAENAPDTGAGTVTVTNLRFSTLAAMFREQMGDRGLDGRIDLHAAFQHDAQSLAPTGSGVVALRTVELAGYTQIDRLEGRLLFTPAFLRLENLAGGLSGGRMQASATYSLTERPSGEFQADLRGAEIDRLLEILLEDGTPLAGRLDVSLRGRLGETLRASGSAMVSRAEAAALRLGTVRGPLQLEFVPATGRGRLTLRSLSASLAGGRIAGNADLSWGNGFDLESRVRFDNVDLPEVLDEFGAGSDWAAGKLTGTLSLKGRNMRSASDLTGSLEARLRNVQAMKLPVLAALRPYLGGVSFNTTFEEGEVQATLARGVVRVQEVSLVSETAQVFVDGTITLGGRLNLQAIIHTGAFRVAGQAAERLVQALALSVAPPAGFLTQASEFLSNRVVYLRIGGTIARPFPRVQPLPILREEAIRFFFNQVVP